MSLEKNKTVVIVAGPTASGKTGVAVELAKHFNTAIISADSRQCFRELIIGVARPSSGQLQTIKHFFVASHSIHDNVNAGTFEAYALQTANDLFQSHDVVIMAGGTGLYLQAFCEGMDQVPFVPHAIRSRIIANYESKGLTWLQNEVKEKDPGFFRIGEIQNPRRLMRALEVAEITGSSILEFHKRKKVNRSFRITKIGLELPKQDQHRNINGRVDKMIDAGLVEEVRRLLPYKSLNALQTVGYSEIFEYLEGRLALDDAIELIKKNTRQYAKRQMTWFKRDKDIKWYSPVDLKKIKDALNNV